MEELVSDSRLLGIYFKNWLWEMQVWENVCFLSHMNFAVMATVKEMCSWIVAAFLVTNLHVF